MKVKHPLIYEKARMRIPLQTNFISDTSYLHRVEKYLRILGKSELLIVVKSSLSMTCGIIFTAIS
jgi:hypothetical protein